MSDDAYARTRELMSQIEAFLATLTQQIIDDDPDMREALRDAKNGEPKCQ